MVAMTILLFVIGFLAIPTGNTAAIWALSAFMDMYGSPLISRFFHNPLMIKKLDLHLPNDSWAHLLRYNS